MTVNGMTPPPEENDAAIARLMSRLADLSDEGPALAAYRMEADAFEPAAAAESVARALISLRAERSPR